MDSERSLNFYKLLHEIEYKIGRSFLNYKGLRFRYPVTFYDSKSKEEKQYDFDFPREYSISEDEPGLEGRRIVKWSKEYFLGEKEYKSARYVCGSNKLFILAGIRNALDMLEERFNINFAQLLEHEKSRRMSHSRGNNLLLQT